jgi:dUTP pyrophosphatase
MKVKKLHANARIPKYQTEGAACFDLHTIEACVIAPGRATTLRTGLAFEVPKGRAMMVYSRSSHGFKHGVRLANCVGVIDSDYRGEVLVRLTNDDSEYVNIYPGDRVAQAMLIQAQQCKLEEVDTLSDTARGTGGFGSTGA